MAGFELKKGMLLGVASAATQVEGGKIDHSWQDWYEKGRIADGSGPERANDHYRLFKDDIKLMKKMGIEVYRFGVEWARLEPEEGGFSEEAFEHYKEELRLLKENGILPLVTLHHFTNPMWFENKGAFTKKENIAYYLMFCEKVVREFGELANEYITINEPNVYAMNGYFSGSWPPGKQSMKLTTAVMSNLVAAHINAYNLIHGVRRDMGLDGTRVGFANHMRVFAPKNPANVRDRLNAKIAKRCFQGALSRAMCLGEITWPLKKVSRSVVSGEYVDFIAVNYYSRTAVSGLSDGTFSGVPKNDLGWEIYPAGITECCKEQYALLPRPIYITENGTCDTDDSFRSRYIYDHLEAVCSSRLPVERYYHWCFTDNFEWLEGESARFGIVHVDYETQKRTVKKSGKFFEEIIKKHGVTDAMYDEYVRDEKYNYID